MQENMQSSVKKKNYTQYRTEIECIGVNQKIL